MAAAGVSYTVGREANSVYGETISGVERALAKNHQFNKGVSAYIKPGDPSSGLLPYVEPDTAEPEGAGDRRVQAYCFRMCLTDEPSNRIPFVKPEGYDPLTYELLLRNLEAIDPETFAKDSARPWKFMPWINSRMPNRKTDTKKFAIASPPVEYAYRHYMSGVQTPFGTDPVPFAPRRRHRRRENGTQHIDERNHITFPTARLPL